MYSSLQLATKYLHYYCTAMNGKGHGMHSPFVFGFILDVLHNRQGYAQPHYLEALRKKLLADKRLLHIADLGAGSRVAASKSRTVRQVAATAAKPPKYSRMLYRLVRHYQPATILELGTSLGLTTAYMAAAHPKAQIITVEGSSDIIKIAKENFTASGLANIQTIVGNFDEVLPQLLQAGTGFDLVFIDGNHRHEPTINYFTQLLSKAHNNTILVFDDIHWSAEMESAWAQIKKHPSVRCTIDIFFMGFVFFKREFREKQDFVIRF
jgi:predicted O-methyltransferase YrrM